MSYPTNKPWTRGPFEIIKHADGHFEKSGDVDRRIALIGFDNAIEICIDVFLRLHPKLRNGYEISGEEKKKALNNYHSKVEFLDDYLAEQDIELSVPFESIIWYHSLRNDLYHSSRGMVPENHVITGARDASVAVFQALFGEQAAQPLFKDSGRPSTDQGSMPYVEGNHEMQFLREFIGFEQLLRKLAESNAKSIISQGRGHRRNIRALWNALAESNENIPESWSKTVKRAMQVRNSLVHGQSTDLSENEVLELAFELKEIAEELINRFRQDGNP